MPFEGYGKVQALAERVGFEPTVPSQVRRISSAVLSTTQPPLQVRVERARKLAGEGMQRKPVAERLPLPQLRCALNGAVQSLSPTFSRRQGTFAGLSDFRLRVRDALSRLGWLGRTSFHWKAFEFQKSS